LRGRSESEESPQIPRQAAVAGPVIAASYSTKQTTLCVESRLPEPPNIRVSQLETDTGSSNRLWIASVFSKYIPPKLRTAQKCRPNVVRTEPNCPLDSIPATLRFPLLSCSKQAKPQHQQTLTARKVNRSTKKRLTPRRLLKIHPREQDSTGGSA